VTTFYPLFDRLHRRSRCPQKQSMALGFTLLEVLIGLAILAISMSITLRALHERTNTTASLRQKIIARWIAQNQWASLQINPTTPSSGVSTQLGQTFYWTIQTDIASSETKAYPAIITITDEQRYPVLTYKHWIWPRPSRPETEEHTQASPSSSTPEGNKP
jgi:type II secretion system protein I